MADRRETLALSSTRPLGARNVTSLVVTGTMTDICVLATVTVVRRPP